MIKLNGNIITPTIFPDGTSQVWRIDQSQYNLDDNRISWFWEGNESELIWVNQLICLMYQMNAPIVELSIPYLPYARQDKEVGNETTFAKSVFLEILLKEHVAELTTLDAHSGHPAITSYTPFRYITQTLSRSNTNVIVYPDSGAYNRYHYWIKDMYQDIKVIVMDKVREQLTGKIVGLEIDYEISTFTGKDYNSMENVNMLIVDDICDGGMTYIKSAQYLHSLYKNLKIDLYVTHGIFSKGTDCIYSSGIANIYTTNSLDVFRKKSGETIENVTVV